MKKIVITSLLLGATLFASDGYEVYKKNCMSCHVEIIDKDKALKNLKDMKAPPMVEVSNRLKENILIKDDEEDLHRHLFILFVKDYISNPKIDFSMCHAGALERFGVMPSLEGKINNEEKQAVAEWLYDRYVNVKF